MVSNSTDTHGGGGGGGGSTPAPNSGNNNHYYAQQQQHQQQQQQQQQGYPSYNHGQPQQQASRPPPQRSYSHGDDSQQQPQQHGHPQYQQHHGYPQQQQSQQQQYQQANAHHGGGNMMAGYGQQPQASTPYHPHHQQQHYQNQPPQQQQQQQQQAPPQTHTNHTSAPTTTASTTLPRPQLRSDVSGGTANTSASFADVSAGASSGENNIITTNGSADEETEDGRIRNREAATKIRDAWIYKQIQNRQDEFTQYKQARLFIGTWNVNAKLADNLDSWLCSDWGPNQEDAPDIVAVGFQEIVDLNAVNVAVDNKTQQRSLFWVDRIRTTLNQRDQERGYVLLVYKHLVGLLLCVFVRAVHKNRVKYVHTDSAGVGVMGMMGNKGGVSVRFQFYDSTICFVCSHLAAHRENVLGRNADYAKVMSNVSFDIGEEAVREVIRSGSLRQWATGSSSVTVPDHDLVFWLGDLNYRIDESIPTETVMEWSNQDKFHDLRVNDQLNHERASGRVFQGFQEGELNFKPTYKYQPGTDVYDTRPDKKIRAPAWCDRVLWMAQDPKHVVQLNYRRSELNMSDHKPVMSTFATTIKDVIQSKREAVYEEVMKLLDKFENQSLPMVGLDRVHLDFGELRYDQKMTLPIKVTNTGKVVAQFRLVPKLDEVVLCKPWITVNPTYGMLIPGEHEATINFTITIDNATAQALNNGREVLEDIVILRLENGRDYYITVTAKYARSCFGMSVDELVMYAEPIRNIPLDPIERANYVESSGNSSATAAALCVPKELWRIVDAIYHRGLHEKELFSTSGLAEEVAEIRECLDTGAPFPEHFHVHSMTEVMVSFLASLSSPIVPPTLFPTLEVDAQNMQSLARKFLEELPPIHYNVFVYIISFFREALLYKEGNQLSSGKLARICCNCLLQNVSNYVEDGAASMQRRTGMHIIMLHFLETNSI